MRISTKTLPVRRAPITWLASYPRSGNTLLRVILNRCFGQLSQSIYDDNEFTDPLVKSWVGLEPAGRDARAFVANARRADRGLFVKTHEAPPNDVNPAIYIVRDGRAAVVSHMHYLREVVGIHVELRDVIDGKLSLSWGDHVRTWAFGGRPNTLVVRFEDLAAGTSATLRDISAFTGLPLLKDFDVTFDMLHARSPLFFRCGSNDDNISEMSTEDLEWFEARHGDMLRRMGYASAMPPAEYRDGTHDRL